ncbi:DUF547 domain-containing protein [Haloarchaeobius sp. HME9146]|uniref:DUF547 domain-containing protein n=1 Tax=Haloarchaeobius sp. HME9146 TaxID=2978732 RepID=UPI0021BF5385|nr:DUF547 domain-containing protein [Haloarchaeobius sp. HME9146]MCT9097753.1 DUF547 domain-containing protein [Haloarchaeobius sp. HME9146]
MSTREVPDPVELAGRFVRAGKTSGDAEAYRQALATLDRRVLRQRVTDDDAKRAFWLNVYNGFAQALLREDPSLWEKAGLLPTRPIFTDALVTVAGHELSLDDIEHGFLRRSKTTWGFGYVPRLRTDSFEKMHRVEEPDPRIHFALNCGAASCPPVAEYTTSGIDEELDRVTASYLHSECDYDEASDVVRVPKLFSWYRGDFGGKTGIVRFLQEYDVVPADASPKLAYSEYDWSLKLGAYTDLEA